MKELLKKFLQKLTRENLSNTCQLGWKAFKWVMQVTEGYHWLITFSIFSGIFGVVMSLVNVAMSKWIIDVATGAQEGNSHNSSLILPAGYGDKTCISLDFWQDQHAHQYPHAKFAVRRPNDVFMERSREMAHRRPADPYQQ